MQTYLYRLKFTTPVHFGSDKTGIGLESNALNCHADTFFSALCHEIISLDGEKELEDFVDKVKVGELLISDLLPYSKNELYLPKPCLIVDKDKKEDDDNENSSKLKKKMKKLQFIPVSKWNEYINFLKIGGDLPFETEEFAESALFSKVGMPRTEQDENGKNAENSLYSVGVNVFKEDCGLYFIASFEEEYKDQFDRVITSLGYSGIGGKRSSGYGKFEVLEDAIELDSENYAEDSDKNLAELFENTVNPDYYMALSCIFPSETDLKQVDGYYSLIQRNGFVASATYSNKPLKRNPIYMFNAGSCFKQELEGEVAEVSNDGNHKVYRYGKALMIGVKL